MTNQDITGTAASLFPKQRRILIACPAYKSLFTSAFVDSFFRLISEAHKQKVAVSFLQLDLGDIVMARNYLVSKFYFDYQSCTHLLFIDNDMGYDPTLIMDMLALDVGVSGVVYPKRKIDLQKLHASGSKPFQQAYAASCEFVGHIPSMHEKPSSIKVIKTVSGITINQTDQDNKRGPFIQAKRIGTGIMLIKRETIASMIEKCPEISGIKKPRNFKLFEKVGGYITPFNKVIVDGHELSEDFSFCHRWTEICGGGIMASTSSSIKHVGELTIDTKLSDTWDT